MVGAMTGSGPLLELAYLARRIADVRVCVLAAMRPVEEEDPLLAELLVDPVTTVVRPNALGVPSVAELVRAELGAEADEPFCLACHRATGGNPPLLRELLRTLASDHMLRPRGDLAGLVLSGRPRPRINRCGGGLARPFGLPGTDSPYRWRSSCPVAVIVMISCAGVQSVAGRSLAVGAAASDQLSAPAVISEGMLPVATGNSSSRSPGVIRPIRSAASRVYHSAWPGPAHSP